MGFRFDRKKFFDAYKEHISAKISQLEVTYVTQILDLAEQDDRIQSKRQLASMIATARWETQRFEKMRESAPNRSYFDQYEGKGGNQPGDGYKFRGNGFCHMTFRNNHLRAQKELAKTGIEIDLISDPDLLWQTPEANYEVMVRGHLEGWFTNFKLGDFVNHHTDYRNARLVINPGELYIANGKWKATPKRKAQCIEAIDRIVAWSQGIEASLRVAMLDKPALMTDIQSSANSEPKPPIEDTLQVNVIETAKVKAGALAKTLLAGLSLETIQSWFVNNRWVSLVIFVLFILAVSFVFRKSLKVLWLKFRRMIASGV